MKLACIKPFGGSYKVSSPFGERVDPVTGEKILHRGVDFALPEGTPIRAVLDGKILVSGWENPASQKQGYGLRIYQECATQKLTVLVVYAHLKEIHKEEGEFVSQSGIIGLSGNTGKSTGPHLHIGIRIKNTSEWIEPEWEDPICSGSKNATCNCLCHKKEDSNAQTV